ncbi:MAG: PAS domain-containing protein [Desulfomicrobium escambiense]|nr:PAS domain-containing protein [Desulfomicrobium escambiense]
MDADDKVMYYSDSPHRVFPREPGDHRPLGAELPPPQERRRWWMKILDAFKNKEKDKADFWIEMDGRFIVISYKPIYDDAGTYLGTLEMSWDATDSHGASKGSGGCWTGRRAQCAPTANRYPDGSVTAICPDQAPILGA